MSRYIDVNKLYVPDKINGISMESAIEHLEIYCSDLADCIHAKFLYAVRDYLEWYKDEIKRASTADVVEVVRCKDCEYWLGRFSQCQKFSIPIGVRENDYCSHGIRMDGGI